MALLADSEQVEEVRVGGRTGTSETSTTLCMVQIYSNPIRAAEFSALITALAERTGLYAIPSYITSDPSGTDDVASSCTWSNLNGSGTGTILGSGFSYGAGLLAGSGLTSVAQSARLCFGIGGSTVEKDPVLRSVVIGLF